MELKTVYISDDDIMIYEVTRPGSLPWSVVVADWKIHSHQRFFTDIHNCSDFNRSKRECRFDFWFLQQCWEALGLPEVLTPKVLNDMLHVRTKSCYPDAELIAKDPRNGPQAEPVVYRKTADDVLETIKDRSSKNIITDTLKRKRAE